MTQVLERHTSDLEAVAIITVRGGNQGFKDSDNIGKIRTCSCRPASGGGEVSDEC